MEFVFQSRDGSAKTLEVKRQSDGSFVVAINDQEYPLTYQVGPSGQLTLIIDGVRQQTYVARHNQRYYVGVAGEVVELERTTRAKQSQSQESADNLMAPMPGQIIQVLVKVGDQVEKGQTLLVLEAMKMEMRVKAPHTGQVHQLFCQLGQVVERGQELIEVK